MDTATREASAFGSRPQLLLCMNLQKEHLAPGRRHMMAGTDDVLTACAAILEGWRARLWPIVHLKRIAHAAWFNPASALTDWIDAYRPRPGELTFEHPLPSAYSSARFAAYMAEIGSATRIVVIGFSLDESILATVIDGYHRGHNLRITGDAVASRKLDYCELQLYRRILLGLVSGYAAIETLENALDPQTHAGREPRLA
jgi:nicotinamidase-related amidase